MTMYWITANEDIKKWEKFDTATTDEESLNNTFQVKLYNYKEAIAASAQNIKDNKSDFHPIINVSTKKGKSFNYETNLVTSKRESFCNAFAWDLENPRSTATPYDNEEISAWLRKAAEIKLTVEKNILIKNHHAISEAQKNQISQLNAALEKIKNETNTEFQKLKDENKKALTLAVNLKETELNQRIQELSTMAGQLENQINGLVAENQQQKQDFDKELKKLQLQSENQKEHHLADKIQLQFKLQKDFEQSLAEQEIKFGKLLADALEQKQNLEDEVNELKATIQETIASEVHRITDAFHKEVTVHVETTMVKVKTENPLRASTSATSATSVQITREDLLEQVEYLQAQSEREVLPQTITTSLPSAEFSLIKHGAYGALSVAAGAVALWYFNNPLAALAGVGAFLGLEGLAFARQKLSNKARVENITRTDGEDFTPNQSEMLALLQDQLEGVADSRLLEREGSAASNVVPLTPQLQHQQDQGKKLEEAAKQAATQAQDQLKISRKVAALARQG